MVFVWDEIKRDSSGKVILLYRHQRMLDEGCVIRGDSVLDIGGWGVLCTALLEGGVDCTILDDFTEDQYYPERVRSLPHIEGDILNDSLIKVLPMYDAVTCYEMLEHCKDQQKAIHNIYKLLKPGGRLMGTFPLPGFAHKEDDPSVNFRTKNELHNLFKLAGFVDISIETTPSIKKENEVHSSFYFKVIK